MPVDIGEQHERASPDDSPAKGARSAALATESGGRVLAGTLSRLAGASPLWLGLAAVVMAVHAQLFLTPDGRPSPSPDTTTSVRWYTLAICILLIGWRGTYANVRLLSQPGAVARGIRGWFAGISRRQTALVGSGIAANALAIVILRGDWYSLSGGILWVGSLVLILAGFMGERVEGAADSRPRSLSRWPLAHIPETAIFAAILAVALTLRLWRLGDLLPGMHGDEGEAGTQALAILNGDLVSPFMRGWLNQPNIYYWALAICMKLFGTGLVGLRTFAVICGMAAVIFTYLITREMFGARAACIAGFFLSFQSAALIFSRQEFSNVTVPPLEAGTLFFLVRGLRTRRHLDFAISGLLGGFAWYFFAGGRLIAPTAGLFLLYLVLTQRPFLRAYWTRVAAFVITLVAILTPFLAFYLAYPLPSNTYPNDRFIWLHHDELSVLYGTQSWLLIGWHQLETTFSVLTLNADVSAMFALDYPVARPLEAGLIVLGLAWALWRWRDARFFLLSLWFWSSIIVGGVLTTEAPNLPRILGMLPVLAILIAVILDALWVQIAEVVSNLGVARSWSAAGMWAGGVVVAGVIVVSGIQNKQMYIDSWLNEHTNTVVTGQAMYVQDHGLNYFYYDLGAPQVYWTHGDNRFINPYAVGEDAVNMPNVLPIIDNGASGERSANFLVWPDSADYLQVLRAYYPEGIEQVFPLGDPTHQTQPLIGYIIPRAVIDKHRAVLAQYAPARGAVIRRREPMLGLDGSNTPPAGLSYPVRASWDGALVAPMYDRYRFTLRAPAGTVLTIDGVKVFPASATANEFLILAQGPHTIHLSARLAGPHARVELLWSGSTVGTGMIPRRYLWDNHIGRSWLGEVRPDLGGASNRVDGFLGFRDTNIAFGFSSGLVGNWRSVLTTHQSGTYAFQLNALNTASLSIDGKRIVTDSTAGPNPTLAAGQAILTRGKHRIEIDYSWQTGIGYLECWWAPPGSPMQLLISPDLSPPGAGVWGPNTNPAVAPPPSPQSTLEPVQPSPGPLIDQG